MQQEKQDFQHAGHEDKKLHAFVPAPAEPTGPGAATECFSPCAYAWELCDRRGTALAGGGRGYRRGFPGGMRRIVQGRVKDE